MEQPSHEIASRAASPASSAGPQPVSRTVSPAPIPARPLLPWIAFGLLFGALAPAALSSAAKRIGIDCGPTGWWWLLGLPVAIGAAWMGDQRWPWVRRLLLASASALLGAHLAGPPLVLETEGPRLVEAHGTVGAVGRVGYGQSFQLLTESGRRWVVAPPVPAIRSGDAVIVRGLWQVTHRGEEITAIELDRSVAREAGPRGWAFRVVDQLGERRELAAALLLGSGSPPEKGSFRRAGLLHVLAVSGAHLAIAAALAWWLLRLAGCPWLPRLLLLSGMVLGYLWLTGAAPATQRAAAMTVAVVLSALFARHPHAISAVAFAALALVVIDPGIAGDLGFQFSLAAVLGIATVGGELQTLRERWLPMRPWPLDRPLWRAGLFAMRSACDGLAIGLGATLAVMPLVAWHLHQLNPWSAVSSVIVAPACAGALWLGLPWMLLAGVWPDGPWGGLASAVQLCLEALARGVDWASTWPGATVMVGAPPVLTLVLWPTLFIRWPWRHQALGRSALALGLIGWWMGMP